MKEFIEKLICRLEECTSIEDYGEIFISLDEVYEIVNQLAEEYNNGWIPCSERLPEETGYNNRYLIQQKDGFMVIASCVKCANDSIAYVWHDGFDVFNPIAWQPLPEPWKAGEAE